MTARDRTSGVPGAHPLPRRPLPDILGSLASGITTMSAPVLLCCTRSRLKITGIVRNLDSNEVEIYCQCANRPILDEFIKRIAIKAKKEDIFAVNVDSVKIYDEKFGAPKADFEGFQIDYGMNVDNFQKESLERSEIGILLLSGTRSDIQAMHSDMNTRFDILENRYGEIGHDIKTVKTDMAKLTSELHNSTEALISMTQKVGALIDKKLAE